MICRLAHLSDLSAIVALGKEMAAQTNLAGIPYNAVIARRTAKRAMTSPNSRVWVIDRDDEIVGLLIGEIGDMPMSHHQSATDLIFIAKAGGDLLLDAFIHWCTMRGVARIDMGVSAGPEREAAIKRMFRRKGFTYSGPCMHRTLLGEGASQ